MFCVILGFATSSCSKDSQPDIHSEVIQCILDHPAFEQYLHSEIEGRLPVQVYGSTIPENTKGLKFTRGNDENITENGIYFTNIEIAPKFATVSLKYPIEGVIASFKLEKKGGAWVIIESNIFETSKS